MAIYPPDEQLLRTVQALVTDCDGNQSEAARRLKTSRLRINRLLSQEGRVTERVRRDLWRGLREAQGGADGDIDQRRAPLVIQEKVSVPELAKQVIQLIADAVDRAYAVEGVDAVRH